MARLKLTLAFDKYDYLQPLRDGSVEPEGIDLNLVTVESGIRHERFYNYGEYDACEFSMCSYLTARGHGVDWFQAIPFFSRRMFGHKFCFVRSGAGFEKPADLRGRRFGIRTYENTLAFMVKGMLMHNYGLPLDGVTWVCVNRELVGAKLPSHIKVEHASGRKLEDLLAAGEIDAEVEPDLPRGFRGKAPSSGSSRTTRAKRSATTRKRKSFRSCTRSSSRRRFSTATPGSRRASTRLSARRKIFTTTSCSSRTG